MINENSKTNKTLHVGGLRNVLYAKLEPFEYGTIKTDVDRIVERFCQYLQTYRPKQFPTTMHGLLGPVGPLLQRSKGKNIDEGFLVATALRSHESKAFVTAEAQQKLADAVKGLVALLDRQDLPEIGKPKILDRIRYRIYGVQKQAQLKFFQDRYSDWIEYLKKKYVDFAKLKEAWLKDLKGKQEIESISKMADWKDLFFPSKARAKGESAVAKDIGEFLGQQEIELEEGGEQNE